MPRFCIRAVRSGSLVMSISAFALSGCSEGSELANVERERLTEQRIENERRDAARQARQDERIKRLEGELRRREPVVDDRPVGQSAATATPDASDRADTTTASAGEHGDWSGGSAYTVILASKPDEAAARQVQREASDAGLDAGVLNSNAFPSLRPGYWVVFSGAHSSQGDAAKRQSRARSLGYGDAYARFIAP